MKQVIDSLNEYIKENEIVVVALSGGPDSMALVKLLLELNKNIKIIACHVNHGLRKESDIEEIFVKNFCIQNNIIFEYLKIKEYTNNKFTEAEARKKRYDFFEEIVNKYQAKYLLTAHHGDDLIETILMRIVRGSTLKGYSGINLITKKDNYLIYRPLIYTTKKEIMNYLDSKGVKYVIDNTNTDTHYTRNRYRANILPFIKQENENAHLKFKKFSDTLLLYDEFVSNICKEKIKEVYKNNKLSIKAFNKLDYLLQKKIIYMILENIYQNKIDKINEKHVEMIFDIILNPNNSMINLPINISVYKEYDYLTFETRKKIEYKIELNKINKLPNNRTIAIIDYIESDSNFECRLNLDEIKPPIYIRTRKTGDFMYVKGMNGKTKKISDILINAKIPKTLRESFPIVTDSEDNILWLPGIKKSKFDRTKCEKYDIILKYY